VEGNEQAPLGAGEEQAGLDRILAHDVDRVWTAADRKPANDLIPCPAAIVRPDDDRSLVVDAVTIDRGISCVRIEVRRLDDPDLRPGLNLRRSDIRPVRAVVVATPD